MAVFTAAVAAVTAAIAAPAVATIGAAAIAVGTAVGTAGLGLSAIGMVTGNKSLQKVGGTMSMVGLGLGVGGGIIGGTKAIGLAATHTKNAWNEGVGKYFTDTSTVASTPASAPPTDGGGIIGPQVSAPSTVPSTKPGVPPAHIPGRTLPGTPPPRLPVQMRTPAPTGASGSWWDDLSTSDKLALGGTALQGVGGIVSGYQKGKEADAMMQLERERLGHGGPDPVPPKKKAA